MAKAEPYCQRPGSSTRPWSPTKGARAAGALRWVLWACALAGASCLARTTIVPLPVTLAPGEGLRVPVLVAVGRQTGKLTVRHRFVFEGQAQELAASVDRGLLAGARATDKRAYRRQGATGVEWLGPWYRSFVDDPGHGPLYDAVLAGMRAIRFRENLDADRYAELLIAYVRSLPYKTDRNAPLPKFPVETVADGQGDCDDKSLLLAALLAREGYDVVLMSFRAEEHMTVGLRGVGALWPRTEYALVETTGPSYVGLPLGTLRGGKPLDSAPLLIRIGGGSGVYNAGADVEYLRDVLGRVQRRRGQLEADLARADAHCAALKADLAAARARMEQANARGDTAGYNRLVPEHNRQVVLSNGCVTARNGQADLFNQLIEVERRIAQGCESRRATVAAVRSLLPAGE